MACKVIEGQSDIWKTKGIRIEQLVDEEIFVYVDELMFEKVLVNLLSNAVKYTPERGWVHIKANLAGATCVVEVIDSGVGMDEQQLQGLFMLNKTISSLGTNNEKGNGLGLVLCKEMIAENNGSIRVESQPGEGTHFIVSLPAGGCGN